MKNFFFLLTFIFFITIPAVANNIATVDIQLIMNTSVAGIDLKKKISSIEKKKIASIKKAEDNIKDKEKTLVDKKNILNEDEFKEEVSKLKLEINEFNLMKRNEIKDFENKKIQYNQKLLVSIQQILGAYSKSNDITLLLQKKNIVMGSKDIDITSDILIILNKNIKEINLK
ncbi:OmpH family outer membrane protein [Candidatus Pelagibacter sp.]|nr:OmpH family outer membrane protein [Candidatus Pelagibacter sp.]